MLTVKLFGESIGFKEVESGSGRGIHFMVNGYCLSCQAGWGNYCSEDPTRTNEKLTQNTIRTNCEIAIWKMPETENWVDLDGDTVMGWVSWDMVLDILIWLRETKDLTDEKVSNKILELKNIYERKERGI